MKKNILFLTILCLLAFAPAQAGVLKAKAVDAISTKTPKDVISVKVARDFALNKEITLKEGDILTGKMTEIVTPDKWHKNATFTFIPTSYTDTQGNKHEITNEIKATYKQKIKPVHTEWGVGTPGGGYFSPQYVSDIKRIAKGEGKEVYEEFESYTAPWGKGMHVDIKADEVLYFTFPD